MTHIITLLTIIILACSCINKQEMISTTGNTPITLEVANPMVFPPESKSSYTLEELNKLSDLNIFVYHNGNLIDRCTRYYKSTANIFMDLPEKKDGFNIYMISNVGDITAKAPATEAEMEKFRYVAPSYADFHTKGFPMANKFLNFKKGSTTVFPLVRMIGQYNLTITTKANDAEYTIKKVRLKNCALDIYPFSNIPIKASTFAKQDENLNENPGDFLNEDDITRLNSGRPVQLFFLENLQGTLLPGNTDPTKKTPVELKDQTVAAHCTYLEIVADIKTPAGMYTNGKYRYYLGADATTNFDIHRNRIYSLSVKMAQDMVYEDGWRIEVAPPTVIGKIHTDKNVARVIKGVEDMIFITSESGNHAKMEYSVEYVQEAFIDNLLRKSTLPASDINFIVKQEPVRGVLRTGVHITSNKEISGIHPLGSIQRPCGTVILGIKSKDKYNGNPVLVKYIEVLVYDKSWPIVFKRNPADRKLYVYIDNPLELNFRVGVFENNKQINNAATNSMTTVSNGDFYRIFSNEEYMDSYGNWVVPDDNRWTNSFNHPTMAYYTAWVTHRQADWTKFNLIDDRPGEMFLRVFIEPLSGKHTNTTNNAINLTCRDQKTHNLESNCHSYIPFPRFIEGKNEIMDMSRKKHQLSPLSTGNFNIKNYPNELENVADNVIVSIPDNASGIYRVDSYGYYGYPTRNIRDVKFVLGSKSINIFNNMNEYRPTKFGRFAFYIANGIATVHELHVENEDPTKTGEKNATLRGFWVGLFGPGRDIDETPHSSHSAEYYTKNLKQLFGNIHRWFLRKNYYTSGPFMSINDYISWPFGAVSSEGVVVPNNIPFN